jgi:hypothetical protein
VEIFPRKNLSRAPYRKSTIDERYDTCNLTHIHTAIQKEFDLFQTDHIRWDCQIRSLRQIFFGTIGKNNDSVSESFRREFYNVLKLMDYVELSYGDTEESTIFRLDKVRKVGVLGQI